MCGVAWLRLQELTASAHVYVGLPLTRIQVTVTNLIFAFTLIAISEFVEILNNLLISISKFLFLVVEHFANSYCAMTVEILS